MKGRIEFKLKNGSVLAIEAEYECIMKNEVIDADGDKVIGREKPFDTKHRMVAFVDGKKIDDSNDASFWKLIDSNMGENKIWGMGIRFTNPEDAERYTEWVNGIIEDGKSEEVRAYEAARLEEREKEELAFAKSTIAKAEKQRDIPTQEEAKRRMKQYNDVVNEGGEGYVPHIISIEEYNYAKQVIEKYGEVGTRV